MYDIIDRPVAGLAPGNRLLLWAMRSWVRTLEVGGCPPGALAPAFLKCHAIEALPHFHRLMAELNGRAMETLRVSPVAYGQVGEWEALVLRLWIDARRDPLNAKATLELLLEEEAVEPAFEALICAAAALAASGLAPDAPVAAPVEGRS